MNWKQKRNLIILPILFLLSGAAAVWGNGIIESNKIIAGNSATEIKLVSGSQQRDFATNLSFQNKCKKVSVASGSFDVFVPYKSETEWLSFLAAYNGTGKNGVTVSDCTCTNDYGHTGTCGVSDRTYAGVNHYAYFTTYYGNGSNPFYLSTTSCGTGNVDDHAFYGCAGLLDDPVEIDADSGAYTHYPNFPGCGYPVTPAASRAISGEYCIRSSYGNNLEWCNGGAVDGSWGIYTCGNHFSNGTAKRADYYIH